LSLSLRPWLPPHRGIVEASRRSGGRRQGAPVVASVELLVWTTIAVAPLLALLAYAVARVRKAHYIEALRHFSGAAGRERAALDLLVAVEDAKRRHANGSLGGDLDALDIAEQCQVPVEAALEAVDVVLGRHTGPNNSA
jgi:hypothetical protein